MSQENIFTLHGAMRSDFNFFSFFRCHVLSPLSSLFSPLLSPLPAYTASAVIHAIGVLSSECHWLCQCGIPRDYIRWPALAKPVALKKRFQ